MTGRVFLDSASHRVTPHHDAGSSGVSHPALRCGVQREKARHSFAGIPGFRIKCGMTGRVFPGFRVAPGHPALDAGSSGVSHPAPRCGVQRGKARHSFAGISGYRVVARYDEVGISGFRVTPGHPAPRCGVQWRESPRTTMRGPEREGEAFICRYSWIPHQVRNDREGISGFRVTPGHPAPRCGVQCVSHPAQRCGVQWRVFPGYRVTPGHPAQRCGVHWPVFLDTAS